MLHVAPVPSSILMPRIALSYVPVAFDLLLAALAMYSVKGSLSPYGDAAEKLRTVNHGVWMGI